MPLSPRTLRPSSSFTPKSISGLALWLDASATGDLYTTDAGPVTAVSSPTEIAGCVAWYDASDAATLFAADTGSTLATTTVGRWANKGTLGSAADLLQATSGARPATGSVTQNGRNVLAFDGTDDSLQRAFTLAQPSTVIAVFACPSTPGSNLTLLDGAGGGNKMRVATTSTNLMMFAGSQVTMSAMTLASTTQWNVRTFAFNGASSAGYATGVVDASGNAGTTSADGLTLAAWGAGGLQYVAVRYAEVIVFNTALSTADRARVEAYLAAKWGISGVHRSATQEIAAVASPAEIAGLSDWYDAADASTVTLSGGKITSWSSKVTGGRTLTQGSDSLRPVLTSSVQNGLPMAKFDGVDDFIRTATPEAFGDKTVFIVARPTDVAATQAVWGASKQNITSYGYFYTAGFRVNSAAIVVRPETAGAAARRITASANEAIITSLQFKTSEILANNFSSTGPYKNGILFDTNDSVALSDYAIGSTMGANDSRPAAGVLSNFYSGYVGEVLVYDTYLSAVDRARVEKYLAAKWGITGVPDPTPPVGYWKDRSGNGRHATQATGGNRPTVSATAVNARRAIGFNGTASRLALPSMDSTPSTVIAVARHNPGTSSAGRTPLCIMEGANYMSWQFQQTGTIRAGVTYNAAQNHFTASGLDPQGSVLLITGQMSAGGGGLLGRLNGAALPGTDTVAYADGGQSRIGCRFRTTDDQFWSGEVCEVLHYQSALSLSQVQRLERYLASRWGITLAPQVSNADAQDWVNRVYANGGAVSTSTASAVNTLCDSLDASGVRPLMYRMGIFAGTGLNAALVPLYRGPSLGGTQYGNATDTNVGPFVSGDYVETGASGGLVGNGSSKYLNTGLAPSALPSVATGHMAAYSPQITPVDSTRAFMGCASGSAQYNLSYSLNTGTGLARLRTTWGGTSGHDANEPSGVFRGGLRLSTRTSATALRTYHNSTQVSLFETSVTPASHVNNWFVFAFNSAGTPIQYSPDTMRAYSIGESMSAEQVAAYYTAMQAFQTALERNV